MRKNYPILLLTLFLVAIAISVGSCSKKVDEIKRNLVIDAMTDGRWLVQTFTDNDTDITSQFASYEFQFYSNGTVSPPFTWRGRYEASLGTATFPLFGNPFADMPGLEGANDADDPTNRTDEIETEILRQSD